MQKPTIASRNSAANDLQELREALRDAIADEVIGKLPPTMTLLEVGALLGATTHDVIRLIDLGDITVNRVDRRIEFRPADNRALLRREILLRLPRDDYPSAQRSA